MCENFDILMNLLKQKEPLPYLEYEKILDSNFTVGEYDNPNKENTRDVHHYLIEIRHMGNIEKYEVSVYV